MGRISIVLIGTINFIFLILGIIIVCNSLYLHAGAGHYCEKHPHLPVIIVGAIMIVVSFIGLMGCCFKDTCLLMIYLSFIFMIILGIMAFTVFAFMISINKGMGGRLEVTNTNNNHQEYRLENFSKWLLKIVEEKNWDRLKTCFVHSQLCNENVTSGFLSHANFSPIQTGCCKAPTSCNLNATKSPFQNVTNGAEEDCVKWKNEENSPCFDCDSCKVGFLTNLRNQFRVMVFQNMFTIVVLMIIYFIGCCARRGIKYRYVAYSAYIKA
ncbi:Tetraspanin-9 [Euphorbia peplus]|nr:Tetraspanin-9 [Euphorbia peplus]